MAARVGGNLVASFVLSVVLLAILGVVSFRAVNTLIANNERVTHTQEVLEELQTVRDAADTG
jgi:Predicted periplasmic ligand-binding sensor domain